MVLVKKAFLFFCDLAILVYISSILFQHSRAGYSMQSWSALFHFMCMIWLILRAIFWLLTLISTTQWDPLTFHLLYWLPNSFEFATFACLPIFYMQLSGTANVNISISQRNADNLWLKNVYIIVTSVVCLSQIVWAIQVQGQGQHGCVGLKDGVDAVANNNNINTDTNANTNTDDNNQKCFGTEYTGIAPRVLTGLLFLLLAIIQGMYSYYVIRHLQLPETETETEIEDINIYRLRLKQYYYFYFHSPMTLIGINLFLECMCY